MVSERWGLFLLLRSGKGRKCSSLLVPPPHLQLTLHWKAEADLKTHMHNRLTICWELEAVGAVGQAEGLRVLSPVSTCMHARAHMHTLMCIHIHAHTHTFICKT